MRDSDHEDDPLLFVDLPDSALVHSFVCVCILPWWRRNPVSRPLPTRMSAPCTEHHWLRRVKVSGRVKSLEVRVSMRSVYV